MAESLIERISLCRVSRKKDEERPWLIRLADIEDGMLKIFRPDKGKPMLFDNRDRLIWNDGPDIDGAFGIWRWSADTDYRDYRKDHVETSYADDLLPAIEIIRLPSAATLEKLSQIMTDSGLISLPANGRFLLCPQSNNSIKYMGFLCSIIDFSEDKGRFILKDSVHNLPLHSFSSNDTITINGSTFYKKLECAGYVRDFLMKDPMEIVRNAILTRISWQKVKPSGLTRSAWQTIRDFITDMPASSVYQEIETACLCSRKEAQNYAERFFLCLEKYISDEDCEGIISAILKNYPGLMAKTEDAISERWHKKHQEKIDEAEKEIEALTRELDAKNNELTTAEKRLEELHNLIQSQEKLAEDVCMKVQKRISDARKDAANFIAEMSFMNPNSESTSHAHVFYSPGKDCDSDDIEYIDSWQQLLDSLSDDLNQAGVARKYARNFAAFLYSAYVNRVPVLMAGPNGEDIADAFSVSLFGKTAGVADCSFSYFPGFEREIKAGNDNIFIVKHSFRSEWITHIPDFQKIGRHFIIHPFAEDLVIEPKSLFTYAIPIFTELIIDSVPKGNYTVSKRSESYKDYLPKKPGAVHDSLLRSFGFTHYAGLRVQAVLDDFHKFAGSEDKDSDYLFALFSYVFLTDSNRDSLLDKFSGTSSGLRKKLSAFMGEHDE